MGKKENQGLVGVQPTVKMKKTRKLNTVKTIQSYLMILGSVTGLIIFVVVPLIWIIRWCLFSYRGWGSITFVGLDNFVRVFSASSAKYWLAVRNTFIFAIGKLLVEIPLALVLAFILGSQLKGRSFFRSVFFMPSMVSVAVIGVVFNYFFNHTQGVMNMFLKTIGASTVKWFSSGTTAMIVVMIASIWQNFGINMLFFMTGLQSISPDLYEAAAIDGASNTRQFFKITIPLLGPVLQMVLMNAILGSLKVTDLVLTLTNGQPKGETEMMMTYVYKTFFGASGFTAQDYGYGSALTVITAIILTIVTIIYLRVTRKSGEVYS